MNRDTTKGLDPRPRMPIVIRDAAHRVRIRSVRQSVRRRAASPRAQRPAHWPRVRWEQWWVQQSAQSPVAWRERQLRRASTRPWSIRTGEGRYQREPYFESGMTYDDYKPSYRLGADARCKKCNAKFEEVENSLARDYETVKGKSRLGWEKAKRRRAPGGTQSIKATFRVLTYGPASAGLSFCSSNSEPDWLTKPRPARARKSDRADQSCLSLTQHGGGTRPALARFPNSRQENEWQQNAPAANHLPLHQGSRKSLPAAARKRRRRAGLQRARQHVPPRTSCRAPRPQCGVASTEIGRMSELEAAADRLAGKDGRTDELSRAFPFNAMKAPSMAQGALNPPEGQSEDPPSSDVSASTITETNISDKTGEPAQPG